MLLAVGGGCMVAGTGGPMPSGPCDMEADCALGESCTGGSCAASSDPDIQLWALIDGLGVTVTDGGDIPVFRGVQGGIHTILTIRSVGLPTDAITDSEIEITLASTGGAAGAITMPNLFFSDLGDGVGEAEDIFITLNAALDLVGQDGMVSITVTSRDEPPVSASLVQRVRFIDGGAG